MTDADALGVHVGQTLAQKYRVERVLGAGGMGIVLAAHHLELDERVAIKLLRPEMLGQPEAVARFAREARAAVKIKSEHVARIYDVGALEGGAPFMVMEYLEGVDLAAWLRDSGPLSTEQSVEFLLQAGEAVAEAHALGIVHRDLKPANLFAVRRPGGQLSIKVLDFGISKVSDPMMAGGATTKTLTVMGSPLYMSPEQMESARAADPRSDIWALGVILYELLTGACPFNGETLPEIVLRVATGTPVPLRGRQPSAPAGLEAVLLRCLEKNPDRRFQTVAELADALVEFAPPRARISVDRISGTLGASALPPAGTATSLSGRPGPLPQRGTATETTSSFGTTASRHRPATVAIGVAVLGAAAVALGGVVVLGTHLLASPAATGAAGTPPTVAVPHVGSGATPGALPEPLASTPASVPAAPEAESPAVVPPPLATTVKAVKARAGQGAAPGPKRETPQAASPNCTPNFYLDAQGEKHFKPECFLNR